MMCVCVLTSECVLERERGQLLYKTTLSCICQCIYECVCIIKCVRETLILHSGLRCLQWAVPPCASVSHQSHVTLQNTYTVQREQCEQMLLWVCMCVWMPCDCSERIMEYDFCRETRDGGTLNVESAFLHTCRFAFRYLWGPRWCRAALSLLLWP